MKLKITNKGFYDRDTAVQKLIPQLSGILLEDSEFQTSYYRYPLYPSENIFAPSIVVVDKKFGVLIIKSFSDEELPEDMDSRLLDLEEYSYNLQKDVEHPRKGLRGKIKINSLIHFPFLTGENSDPKIILGDLDITKLSLENNELNDVDWKVLLNTIQNLDALSKNKGIKIKNPPKNLSEAIVFNNQKIGIFDDEQAFAAMTENGGGTRIRGLAGTGKTIVLAWKAAFLHYQYPDKKILYTFYTKSLYNQIKWLIINFYKKYNLSEEPNWENLQILHAWGGRNKRGVYYDCCLRDNIKPETYGDYRLQKHPFGKACGTILKNNLTEYFDYVLIDEAQDLPGEYFKILAKITTPGKNIDIAYDELQSLEDLQLPDFTELFGQDESGKDVVPMSSDIILDKSYRNPMKVLHTAIALGFGTYSKHGVTQMIDSSANWKAIGYNLLAGKLEPDNDIELERPKENSPNNSEEIYPKIPSLNVDTFSDKKEELDFVSEKIKELILIEKVNPRDILVINLGKDSKSDFIKMQSNLYRNEINVKIPGYFDEAEDFFIEGHVTLTTALRSKGNEAPIIIVMGLEKITDDTDEVWRRINRSFIFVAMTRAKGWCFLTASGEGGASFLEEYERVSEDFPKLKLKYPSKKEMDRIRKIDYITKDEQAKKEYFEELQAIKKLLNSKTAYLPENLVEKLKKELGSRFNG